jgi:hypothetical protein
MLFFYLPLILLEAMLPSPKHKSVRARQFTSPL